MIKLLLTLALPLCAADYRAAEAFPKLEFDHPLFLTAAPDGRVFVVEQGGRVYAFANDPKVKKKRLVMDIAGLLRQRHNEEGLLGFALHPHFKKNREVFAYYSASDPRRTVLARWTMNKDATRILKKSHDVLLEIEQPYGNHNGGMIAFGPDGYLYVAVGDGGAGGDPHNAGQRLDTLLGKILRIDIDRSSDGKRYAIPRSNPFRAYGEARGEIWAYGLRNPWRFSFDRKTGELWAGDVGQNKWEEIDIIKKGGNYGWNIKEGLRDYARAGRRGRFIDPVAVHNRREAESITGGYVYRGRRLPELAGRYIYGDFMTGNIWSLVKGGTPQLIARGELISSFGEDAAGELYWTSLSGEIYRLDRK